MEQFRGFQYENLPANINTVHYYINSPTNSPTAGVLSEHYPVAIPGRRPSLFRRHEFYDSYYGTSYRNSSSSSDSSQVPPDVNAPGPAQKDLPKFKSAARSRSGGREVVCEGTSMSQENPNRSEITIEAKPLVPDLPMELRRASGLPFAPDSEIPLVLTLPMGLRRASEENPPLPVGLKGENEVPTTPGEEYRGNNESPSALESPIPTTPREEYKGLNEFPFALTINTKPSTCKEQEVPDSAIDVNSPRSSIGSSTMASSIFGSVQSRKSSSATRSSRATTVGSIDGTLAKCVSNPRASLKPARPRLESVVSQGNLELPTPALAAPTVTAPNLRPQLQLRFSEPPRLRSSLRQQSAEKKGLMKRFNFKFDRCLARREDRKYAANLAKHRRTCNRELNKLAVNIHREKQKRLKGQEKSMVKEGKRELRDMEKKEDKKRDLGKVVDGMFGWKLVR